MKLSQGKLLQIRSDVILLLNRERVMFEVIELARLRIAQALHVPTGKVEATVRVEDGKVQVQFEAKDIAGMTDAEVGKVIEFEYTAVRERTHVRFERLGDRWHGEENTTEA